MREVEKNCAFDLFDIEGGTQPPKSQFVYEASAGYVRLVQIRDFESDGHETYIPENKKWRRCSKDDTLIGRYGAAVGRICRGLSGVYNVALAKVVPREGVDPEYLHYLLRSDFFQAQLLAGSGRSAQAGFNKNDLRSISLPVLPACEQLAVGKLLRPLDDKIELNRRMNETLELIARAIFKDWFADFGPTRANANGHEPYLAPELWDLFPDALDDEDKPEGWHHWTIAELAVHHRATVAPAEYPDRVFEHFSIPAYDAGRNPVIDNGASIKSRKTAIPTNAVLLSKLNPNLPRVWIPNPPNSLPQVASTEFLAFTPKPPATRSLLYCLFRDIQFRREMEAMVTGTSKSHQRVSPKALMQRRVLAGASDALEEFDRYVSPLLSQVLRNRRESRILAQTRDLLLPKLMSGEIRLGEAEKAVEAIL